MSTKPPLWSGLLLSPDNMPVAFGNAITHATFWLIVFALFTEHPIEEWPFSIATTYAAWLIAIRVIARVGGFSGRRLVNRLDVAMAHMGGFEAMSREFQLDTRMMIQLGLIMLLGLVSIVLFAMGAALTIADVVLVQLSFLALPEWMVILGNSLGILGCLIFSLLTSLSWLSVIWLQRGHALGARDDSPNVLVLLPWFWPRVMMVPTGRGT